MRQFLQQKWKEILITIVLCFVIIPFGFNFLIMWDSGLAKGEASDWFTFHGNIVGGLIGGIFTYIALLLTFKKNEELEAAKEEENINIRIKECILSNKTFLEELDTEFKAIQMYVSFEDLNNAIKVEIEAENYDFSSLPKFKSFGVSKEKYNARLAEILKITTTFEQKLKDDLINLSGNEYYIKQHNILVFINHLKYIVRLEIYNKVYDPEILSNFVIWEDGFGLRYILNQLIDVNKDDYEKLISEDIISDYFRSVKIPHIKG